MRCRAIGSLYWLGDLLSHSAVSSTLKQKVDFFKFLTFCLRVLETAEWLNRSPSQYNEPVALHLIYLYLKF